jgi:hypothetical protein
VRLLQRHSHSRHLPQTRRRRTITACSRHPPDVVSHLCPDQTSIRTGASHLLIDTCTAAEPARPRRTTATAQHRPRTHTAIKAPLTRAARRWRGPRSLTSPWFSRGNAPMQVLRPKRTHMIHARATTYLPVQTASQTGQANRSRMAGTCMVPMGKGVPRTVRMKSGGGHWENHTIADRVLQSSWAACRLPRTAVGLRRCSPSRTLSSVHRAIPAAPWVPRPLPETPGDSPSPKSLRERSPR